MFCPACGNDNYDGRKFCASCGTNLDVVSRALYSNSTGLLKRAENGLDQVLCRYAERVFKNAPANVPTQKTSDAWRVFGQALMTLPVDFILFWLMLFVVLPLKLITLLLSTPFKLLVQRGGRNKSPLTTGAAETREPVAQLPEPRWDAASPVSAVDHTTEHLTEYQSRRSRRRANTD